MLRSSQASSQTATAQRRMRPRLLPEEAGGQDAEWGVRLFRFLIFMTISS